jgi:hypothetical protein
MPSLNHRAAIAALALGIPVACLVAPAAFGKLDLGERPVGDALRLLPGRKP